jgi:hypothetical protein
MTRITSSPQIVPRTAIASRGKAGSGRLDAGATGRAGGEDGGQRT